jgi:hypothetical protein
MNIDQIRKFHQASPFQPFMIHMADGRHLPVHHPEFMIISPIEDECIVYEPDGTLHFVDVNLVTDLERMRQEHKQRRSGKKAS